MTEEMIKQKAEDYLKQIPYYGEFLSPMTLQTIKEAHTAGAHSREEEIEKIKEGKCSLRRSLHRRISALVKEIDGLEDELKKLRNPWISVEEGLPEEGTEVLCKNMGGWNLLAIYDGEQWLDPESRMLIPSKITHWMPIPQFHWTPIPQLKKGGEK